MRLPTLERRLPLIERLRLMWRRLRGRRPNDFVRLLRYRRPFFAAPFVRFFHETIYADDVWSPAERQDIAARVAEAQRCAFCTVMHRKKAAQLGGATGPRVTAVQPFLERLAAAPWQPPREEIDEAIAAGRSREELESAVYVTALMSVATRLADAFGFDVPGARDGTAIGRRPGSLTRRPRGGSG